MQHRWQGSSGGFAIGWGWSRGLVNVGTESLFWSAFTELEALFCQVRQGVLGLAVQGYNGTPTENGITQLLVIDSLLSFQLLEETDSKVVRRFVIPSAIGSLCRLVVLLEIGVQVGTLMVLLFERALGFFNR